MPLSSFRMSQLIPPLARWGVAAGSVGFFLLYEEIPQLVMQTQYGNFPGWTGMMAHLGFIKAPPKED
jgi:hypothetical protein